MPGAKLDGASVYDILENRESDHDRRRADRLARLCCTTCASEGQAAPRRSSRRPSAARPVRPTMIRAFEDDYGVQVRHAWGMTEMSRVGSSGSIKPSQVGLSHEEKLAIQSKQGWAPFGVEMRIVDDNNEEVPWDGKRSAGSR